MKDQAKVVRMVIVMLFITLFTIGIVSAAKLGSPNWVNFVVSGIAIFTTVSMNETLKILAKTK